MSNAVPHLRLAASNPSSLRAQLQLASAHETLRRLKSHDRLPAQMAQKAFRDATKLLRETAESCR